MHKANNLGGQFGERARLRFAYPDIYSTRFHFICKQLFTVEMHLLFCEVYFQRIKFTRGFQETMLLEKKKQPNFLFL